MSAAKRKSRSKRTRRKDTKPRIKWAPLDQLAAEKVADATNAPGVIWPFPVSALPKAVARMPRAVSYFVSAYTTPKVIARTITAGGEMVVLRTDAGLRK